MTAVIKNMEDCAESVSTPSPTKEQSKGIQAINKDTVHRICSGQVVLNLATAVKELVENSLDAGATSVEIRLREYGSELIEVIDNGCGVEEANFSGLTLKHHTSKLREFSDLVDVGTFGFRGEALSSLCALSEMTVTTKHTSCEIGTKLSFDSRGHIRSQIPCARQVGTTVQLANIFSSLPVRQKEFLRNLKREFMKMTQLLYAYCLISTGVKFLCTNQTKKGIRSVVASTQGSASYKGNIACIFGAKQAGTLLDIEQEDPKGEHLEEMGLGNTLHTSNIFELEGCISSCAHGQGRSATDRQFFYINSRPCEPTKVSKVVNEVYHQYNTHQSPFVFLNIKTARCGVDVNVTPDKRQIFLDNEKLLLATVKATLLKLYEKIPCSLQFQNVAIASSRSECSPSAPKTPMPSPSQMLSPASSSVASVRTPLRGLSSLLKSFSHSPGASDTDRTSESSPRQTQQTRRGIKRTLDTSVYDRDGKKQLCLSAFVKSDDHIINSTAEQEPTKISETLIQNDVVDDNYAQATTEACNSFPTLEAENRNSEKQIFSIGCDPPKLDMDIEKKKDGSDGVGSVAISNCGDSASITSTEILTSDLSSRVQCVEADFSAETETTSENLAGVEVSASPIFDKPDVDTMSGRKVVYLNITMDTVRQKSREKQQKKQGSDLSTDNKEGKPRVRFYSEINPSMNKTAEQELKKEISKDMFCKMVIIGQFNLGFIITRLGPDIFIVDQHATDEKYNFEMLQLHTVIHNQKLVIPQALELTAVNESILIDNIDIFHKNGFEFVIDNDAQPTKRVRLAAKPTSRNWEFGKEDIDELLFMLQDSPHTMCRPSRVRSMFASRACRKSVMIGTALSKSTMRQLIRHMGEIEQPWNCPHGRPTMRHLVNLELVRKLQ